MTRRSLAAALLLLLAPAGAFAQQCTNVTVQEQWYESVNDLVYIYAGEINSSGPGGHRPFQLRVLVGTYRPPLLLPRAFMLEPDLDLSLKSRPDVKQLRLNVGNPLTGETMPVPYSKGRLTLRVLKVNAAPPGGTDSVLVQACR